MTNTCEGVKPWRRTILPAQRPFKFMNELGKHMSTLVAPAASVPSAIFAPSEERSSVNVPAAAINRLTRYLAGIVRRARRSQDFAVRQAANRASVR